MHDVACKVILPDAAAHQGAFDHAHGIDDIQVDVTGQHILPTSEQPTRVEHFRIPRLDIYDVPCVQDDVLGPEGRFLSRVQAQRNADDLSPAPLGPALGQVGALPGKLGARVCPRTETVVPALDEHLVLGIEPRETTGPSQGIEQIVPVRRQVELVAGAALGAAEQAGLADGEIAGVLPNHQNVVAPRLLQLHQQPFRAGFQDFLRRGVGLADDLLHFHQGLPANLQRRNQRQGDGAVFTDRDRVAHNRSARGLIDSLDRHRLVAFPQDALDPDAKDIAGIQTVDGGRGLLQQGQRNWFRIFPRSAQQMGRQAIDRNAQGGGIGPRRTTVQQERQRNQQTGSQETDGTHAVFFLSLVVVHFWGPFPINVPGKAGARGWCPPWSQTGVSWPGCWCPATPRAACL